MWAQALTVGVLIAAGALTHAQRQKAMENRTVDHSWMEMLEEQQREDAEAAAAAPAATTKIVLPTRAAPAPLQVAA